MAKNKASKGDSSEKNVSAEITKMKKNMTLVIILMFVLLAVVGVGVFFIATGSGNKEASSEAVVVETTNLKDLKPEATEGVYSRDIAKQTYMIPGGGILFEGTLVFYNKECANLYNGITDLKTQQATTPEFTETETIGDKIAKSTLISLFQGESKENLKSTANLATTLKDAVNKSFMDKYNQEIIKEVLVTNHVVQ